MIKSFSPATCAFDCEWVPCPITARRLLNLPAGCSDREASEAVWRAYAKEDGERPFLKLVLCKVVTISAVFRAATPESHIVLELFTGDCDEHGEAHLITSFLERVAGGGLQLWGFNSASADLPILKQRAIALDAPLPKFSRRPPKPWEGMDYHDARNSDAHIDILEQIGAFGGGAAKPKLHELAVACGLPGKLDVAGDNVAEMYLAGRIAEIREYNETDAVTTHLLMLRLAHVAGFLSDDSYHCELLAVEKLLQEQIGKGKTQFEKFRKNWGGTSGELREAGAKPPPSAAAEIPAEQATRLRERWKEFQVKIKAKHGPNLPAALQAVRGITVSGRTMGFYFGSNEFSRDMCLKYCDLLEAETAEFLGEEHLALEFMTGEPPSSSRPT